MRFVPFRFTSVALSLAVVPAVVVLPVVTKPEPRPHAVPPAVRLLAMGTETVSPVTTGAVSLVGASWRAGTMPRGVDLQVRARTAKGWSSWSAIEPTDMGPDDGTADARGMAGRVVSEPVWVGFADAAQARVVGRAEVRARQPSDLRIVLVDPGRSAADATPAPVLPAGSAYASIDQPKIYTRDDWGADESLRRNQCGNDVDYSDTIKVGFVHHTDTSNSYSKSDVPAMIRSIYAYHVRGNGWCDVGYNFLVDKFGRVWEGRWGGITKPVIGAHTGGFNTNAFGAAALGTFTSHQPRSDMVKAFQRLFAWKLGLHYRDPAAKDVLTSAGGGTSRYPAGREVTFNVVSGHRNAGYTACPGGALYSKLGKIRSRATELLGAGFLAPSLSAKSDADIGAATFAVRAGVTRKLSWSLTVTNKSTGAVVKKQSGTASRSRPIATGWDRRDARGVPVPAGSYLMSLTGGTDDSEAYPFTRTVKITAPAPVRPVADVFGSGHSDLVTGVPGRRVGSDESAGAVVVHRGGTGGLPKAPAAVVTQGSPGVPGGAEAEDRFGAAVAAGDFNGDGFADVAVGVPGEDIEEVSNAGLVEVFPGGPDGPQTTEAYVVAQNTPGVAGAPERGDRFGSALATGDLNRDGRDDLVIGVAGEDIIDTADAGMVTVVPGSAQGLLPKSSRSFSQSTAGVPGQLVAGGRLGKVVTAADLTGDAIDDAVLAAPGDNAVILLRGGASGVTATSASRVNGGAVGQLSDFGRALAVGRFNGSTSALAVGGENGVTVLSSGAAGLVAAGAVTWTQDTAGVPGIEEEGDDFGAALAAGDIDLDGREDLAIGNPREDGDVLVDSGAVTVLYGSPTGLSSIGAQSTSQGTPVVPGAAEAGDLFGATLALLHLNNGAYADLAVGSPGEDVGDTDAAGLTTALLGGQSGLPQDTERVVSVTIARGTDLEARLADGFGSALAGR